MKPTKDWMQVVGFLLASLNALIQVPILMVAFIMTYLLYLPTLGHSVCILQPLENEFVWVMDWIIDKFGL